MSSILVDIYQNPSYYRLHHTSCSIPNNGSSSDPLSPCLPTSTDQPCVADPDYSDFPLQLARNSLKLFRGLQASFVALFRASLPWVSLTGLCRRWNRADGYSQTILHPTRRARCIANYIRLRQLGLVANQGVEGKQGAREGSNGGQRQIQY